MASTADDLFFASITELNTKLKARDISAVELTKAFLQRLDQLGTRYNALALLMEKDAIRAAKDVDGDIKRERFRGPLQGIPFGAKDLLSYAKLPTTWGAKPYSDQVFDDTANVLKKILHSGGILTGKLSLVELAGGPNYRYAKASLTGPGLNPWDPQHWSGGSSSGSAIAVAGGMVTYALGSETSGSILTPSAFCGVTGLRPTFGLVSRQGAMPLAWSMDKIGPICRSAEDCGLVLQHIAGKDSDDPSSAGKGFYFAPQFTEAFPQLKVGFATVDFDEWADPAARPDFSKALDVIRGMGVQLTDAKLPDFPYHALTSTIIGAEASSVFEKLITSGRVNELADAEQIAGLKAGLEITANDYLKAMRIRTLLKNAFRDLLADIDVLVAPTRLGPAPLVNEALDYSGTRANQADPQKPGLTSLIAAGNLAGLPALSLPCGFAGKLPIAIQLVGRPFSENTLLTIGREFQKQTDWHKRRPPVPAAAPS